MSSSRKYCEILFSLIICIFLQLFLLLTAFVREMPLKGRNGKTKLVASFITSSWKRPGCPLITRFQLVQTRLNESCVELNLKVFRFFIKPIKVLRFFMKPIKGFQGAPALITADQSYGTLLFVSLQPLLLHFYTIPWRFLYVQHILNRICVREFLLFKEKTSSPLSPPPLPPPAPPPSLPPPLQVPPCRWFSPLQSLLSELRDENGQ